jgi:hypothetical protein
MRADSSVRPRSVSDGSVLGILRLVEPAQGSETLGFSSGRASVRSPTVIG